MTLKDLRDGAKIVKTGIYRDIKTAQRARIRAEMIHGGSLSCEAINELTGQKVSIY